MFAGQSQHSSPRSDLSDLPLERIEHELVELASHLYAGTCRWLDLVAEFDRRDGFGDWGCRSTAEWISWRCAVSPRAAREQVRVARALAELPRIHEAFARGELSYSKVRALSRVATEASEAELLELSRHATAAQLERMLRAYRRISTAEAKRARENAYLAYCWEDDGSLYISGRLPAEDGATLLRALDAARDMLWERQFEGGGSAEPQAASNGSAEPQTREGGSAEPQTPRHTHADALALVAETVVAVGPMGAGAGERYQVTVHVDASTLARDDPEGRSELEDGPSISPETARRLSCDASLISLIESEDGSPLSVGRKTRSIPPALRRALEFRDRGCRFPGCERRRFLEGHHLIPWAHGGETSLENLISLCRFHHHSLHEGGFRAERLADGKVVFRSPHGWELQASPPLGRAHGAELRRRNRDAGLRIDSDTCLSGSGERMDLAACVGAVVAFCDEQQDP